METPCLYLVNLHTVTIYLHNPLKEYSFLLEIPKEAVLDSTPKFDSFSELEQKAALITAAFDASLNYILPKDYPDPNTTVMQDSIRPVMTDRERLTAELLMEHKPRYTSPEGVKFWHLK